MLIDDMDTTESDSKEGSSKLNFDKELMVDLLLNGDDEEDEAKALHEYVTGEAAKTSSMPPPPPPTYDTTTLNGTLDMNSTFPG